MPEQKILVLAAHPDDELVGCGISIKNNIEMGNEVLVLFLTNGCIPVEELWFWQKWKHSKAVARRLKEAQDVADILGHKIKIAKENRPARKLWRGLNAAYNEVKQVIDEYEPSQIWVCAYEGGNPDHDCLNAIGYKLHTEGFEVLEFAEYNYKDGKKNYNTFIAFAKDAKVIELTKEESKFKKELYKKYTSEKGNLNLGIKQESYRPIRKYDYHSPPHKGELWYERFRQVPFHHPRIDRNDKTAISRAIMAFINLYS
ncbi:MAG: PIG-L family deacetylase [Alphaproteobacteria bacterium]|nr:PIG-L family deacetylase [Alphaproteobacteria bacterium]MCL2505824.1 PIG-L family deacetylase [Alphaproteobacteria bacterium]